MNLFVVIGIECLTEYYRFCSIFIILIRMGPVDAGNLRDIQNWVRNGLVKDGDTNLVPIDRLVFY